MVADHSRIGVMAKMQKKTLSDPEEKVCSTRAIGACYIRRSYVWTCYLAAGMEMVHEGKTDR